MIGSLVCSIQSLPVVVLYYSTTLLLYYSMSDLYIYIRYIHALSVHRLSRGRTAARCRISNTLCAICVRGEARAGMQQRGTPSDWMRDLRRSSGRVVERSRGREVEWKDGRLGTGSRRRLLYDVVHYY